MDKILWRLKLAETVSEASKDPSTKVGADITTKDFRPVSQGYNGFIQGCDEKYMTQDRPMKYRQVIHAEMNAILFAKQDLRDCLMFTTHSPCSGCLKHMLQAGISQFYFSNLGPSVIRGGKEEREALNSIMLATGIYGWCPGKNKNYLQLINEIGEGLHGSQAHDLESSRETESLENQ